MKSTREDFTPKAKLHEALQEAAFESNNSSLLTFIHFYATLKQLAQNRLDKDYLSVYIGKKS